MLKSPLDSCSFMNWGAKGKGNWITVYTNPGHAYVMIAGLRLDTGHATARRAEDGQRARQRSALAQDTTSTRATGPATLAASSPLHILPRA